MASTITTTTNASPWAYPANTRMDVRPPTNQLFALVKTSTADTYQLFFASAPGWAAWTSHTSTVRANIVDAGSIFVTNDDWLYWCYRTNEGSQDRIYVRRMYIANGVWSAEILVDAAANGGTAGAVYGGLDMAVVVYAGQVILVIAAGVTVGSQVGVSMRGVYWDTSATPLVTQNIVPGNRQWLYTGSGRIQPSIDIEHNGDGKSSGVPHLWVAFGRDRLQMVKMAWHGGGWSGPTQAQELIATGMAAREYTSARWDGNEWLMVVPNPTTTDTVLLLERNQANTATITRTSPPLPTGVPRHVGLSYNKVTRDVRVYAVGTSTAVLYYVDYVRATGVWTSWSTVTATAVLGSTGQEWGVRRGSTGDAKHDVYTAHSGGTLTHTNQPLTYAPFTPTYVTRTGQPADVAAALALQWTFADSDPGDTQSAYAISRQIGAAAVAYWRASDSTWQPAEVQNAAGSDWISVPAGWGANADAPHTYKVKVWDSAPTASSYSDALVVIPSALVNPNVTAPTAGQVLTGDSVAVTWTAAEQSQYQVILSNAGAEDTWTRTVAAGSWGTATSGNVWQGSDPVWSVNGSSGRSTHAAGGQVLNTLGGTAGTADVRAVVKFIAGQKLTGSGAMFPSLMLRQVDASNFYRIGLYYQASATAAGSVGVVIEKIVAGANTGLFSNFSFDVYDGSEFFWLKAEVVGTTIRVKVWRSVIAEPVAWTASITDATFAAGSVGVVSSRDAGVTNASPYIAWDDLTVTVLPALHDSGWRAGGAVTYTPPVTLLNGGAYTVTLATRNLEGLPSVPQSRNVSVSFLAPDTPTIVNTPVHASGYITVAVTNPTPTGGRPAVASNAVYRRPVGDTSNGVRVAAGLAAGGSYNDWQSVSGVPYEYRTLSKGVNGTSTFSLWTT